MEISKPSVRIFRLVQTDQLRNGVRYQDYLRYSKFCSRKLYRLRSGCKLIGGKKRFKAVPFPETISHARPLEILIFSTERAWSLATDLKSVAANSEKHISAIKHHSKSRFKKAAALGRELHRQCERLCDKDTAEEALAYSRLMEVEYLVECGRYSEAMDPLLKARETLCRFAVTFQHEAYQNRIDSLEPIFRLLKFHASDYLSPKRSAIKMDSENDALIASSARTEIAKNLEICSQALSTGRSTEAGFSACNRALQNFGTLRLLPSGSDFAEEISRSIEILTALKFLWISQGLHAIGKNLEAFALLRAASLPEDISDSVLSLILSGLPGELQRLRIRAGARLFSDSGEEEMSMASAEEETPAPMGFVGKLTGWFRR